MSRALIVFLDGVGIGPANPETNAFVAAPPRTLTEWLDGALIAERTEPLHTAMASLVPLDAQLGVPGLPQSGTGQFSLLTGENGALRFGRHYGPWVPTALRGPLLRDNVLTRARDAGLRVAFANAFPEELIEAAHADGEFRAIGPLRAGPPLVAVGAAALVRHTPELQEGGAVSSEITNESWREKLGRHDLPQILPHDAGVNLARIANANDLTLFAHYHTDYVGHKQDLAQAIEALHVVDDFLTGLWTQLDADMQVLVVSDHGNLEDATTGHTRNPALGLITGPGHDEVADTLRSILDVASVV